MTVTKAICKTLNVTIRRAAPAELPACAALYQHVGAATFTWRPKGWFQAADFLAHAKNEEVYLAQSYDARLAIMSFFRPSNFIHSLYVSVSAQGFGIGTALINTAEKIADGPLSLKVDEPNAKARAFYERQGFVPEGETGVDQGIRWIRLIRPKR